mgnify:CR=1 FL=1
MGRLRETRYNPACHNNHCCASYHSVLGDYEYIRATYKVSWRSEWSCYFFRNSFYSGEAGNIPVNSIRPLTICVTPSRNSHSFCCGKTLDPSCSGFIVKHCAHEYLLFLTQQRMFAGTLIIHHLRATTLLFLFSSLRIRGAESNKTQSEGPRLQLSNENITKRSVREKI